MLNRSAEPLDSTSVLEALPGKLDIKIHSPSILYVLPENQERYHKSLHLLQLLLTLLVSSHIRVPSEIQKHNSMIFL